MRHLEHLRPERVGPELPLQLLRERPRPRVDLREVGEDVCPRREQRVGAQEERARLPPQPDVAAPRAPLLDARRGELELQRDRRVVEVDAVGVEAAPQRDRRREDDDLHPADEPRRPARRLRVLDVRIGVLEELHRLLVRRGRVPVARLPVLAHVLAEPTEELGHPRDVVVVRVGADDEREEVAVGGHGREERRAAKRLEQRRQLPGTADVDDDRAPRPVRPRGQEEQLQVAVADVEEEVDEVLRIDPREEVVVAEGTVREAASGRSARPRSRRLHLLHLLRLPRRERRRDGGEERLLGLVARGLSEVAGPDAAATRSARGGAPRPASARTG